MKPVYVSASKGPIAIADMNIVHVSNAIKKLRAREETFDKPLTPDEMLTLGHLEDRLAEGPLPEVDP